jgi:hypothetical protein
MQGIGKSMVILRGQIPEAQEDKIHRLQERVDEYRDFIDNEHEATREYLLARFKRLHRDVL